MSPIAMVALLLGALAVAGYAAGSWLEASLLMTLTKPAPVLAMLVAALAGPGRRDRTTWLVAAGLALSALGDVALAPPFSHFVGGLVSFLLAHVAYIAAFTAAAPTLSPRRAVVPFGYGVAAFLTLSPGLGEMTLPVACYIAVICAMLWRAGALSKSGDPGGALALIGAALFVTSDTLLAVHRFRAPIPWERLLIMSTYGAGQLGITLAVLRRRARGG